MHRREFLSSLAWAAAPVALAAAPAAPKLKLSVFTKHLQFLGSGEPLADAIAALGFDGADVALRKGGSIEPERAKVEFPALVKALRARKVEVPMITSGIVDADSPNAEAVLQVLQEQGVRYYRWGGFRYDYERPLAAQIDACKPRVAKLAALNRKYGVCAIYHTHSGLNQLGASIWDLHELLRDVDPAVCAINYDIGHATVEGGYGGWINSFHIAGAHLRGIALKDFTWTRDAKTNEPRPRWCPAGDGLVSFGKFFRMLAASRFDGPVQVHYEYPLGGADSGKTEITIPKEQVFAAMKKDLAAYRGWMQQAGI
jgi:sugar phosphate isomerase/epimerase